MNLEQLKKELATEAKAKGICSEWYNFILSAPSKERLITLFIKGLDFCIYNDFPAAHLRAEFAGIRQHYGIFVNDRINVKSSRNIIAFGTSEGKADFTNFDVAQIWARDDTRITVRVRNNAFVCIDIADRAEIEIIASDAARVSVFLHGGTYTSKPTGNAKIKVIDKRK